MAIISVPIRTNKELRPSRLFPNTFSILKVNCYNYPNICSLPAVSLFYSNSNISFDAWSTARVKVSVLFFSGDGDGYVQSVILSGVLLGMGFQTVIMAFVADLMAVNRNLLEKIRYNYMSRSLLNRSIKLDDDKRDKKLMADQGSEGLLSPFLRYQRCAAAKPVFIRRCLGCGVGIGLLAKEIPADSYLGVDTDTTSLSIANAQNPAHSFQVNLPNDDQKFDTIVALAVIEHIKSPAEFLITCAKYLK